jgi:hypothetical protein
MYQKEILNCVIVSERFYFLSPFGIQYPLSGPYNVYNIITLSLSLFSTHYAVIMDGVQGEQLKLAWMSYLNSFGAVKAKSGTLFTKEPLPHVFFINSANFL